MLILVLVFSDLDWLILFGGWLISVFSLGFAIECCLVGLVGIFVFFGWGIVGYQLLGLHVVVCCVMLVVWGVCV